MLRVVGLLSRQFRSMRIMAGCIWLSWSEALERTPFFIFVGGGTSSCHEMLNQG